MVGMNSKLLLIGSISIVVIITLVFTSVPTDTISKNDAVMKLKPYDYEDVCGFPVTDEMRLNIISEESTRFTNDGMSYLKVRGANFSHVELSQYNHDIVPALQYWYELRNGEQVYFEIGVCDIDNPKITLGTMGSTYLKAIPDNCDDEFEKLSVPGFPLVNCYTMEPVLDVDNCKGLAEYYTKMQSPTMFTRENVTFDPLWKDQVFPLMDYCNDIGNFKMDIIGEKLKWSFTV